MLRAEWSGAWPLRAVRRQTFEPAALAGTVTEPMAEPLLPTPLSSDDRAELKTPSIVPQTVRRSVSSKSLFAQSLLRLMVEPAGTEESAAGVLVRCSDPSWAPAIRLGQFVTALAPATPAGRPMPSVVSPPMSVTAA